MKLIYVVNSISSKEEFLHFKNLINNINFEKNSIVVISLFGKNAKKELRFLNDKKIKAINLNLKKPLAYIYGGHKLKEVLSEHSDYILHVYGKRAAVVCRNINSYKIATTHTNMNELGILSRLYIKFSLKKYNSIIATSKTIKKSYKGLKMKVIPNAFDSKMFDIYNKKEIRSDLDITKGKTVYLFEGILDKDNRISDLIKAFDIHSMEDDLLFIVGNGPLSKDALENCSNKIRIFQKEKDYLKYYVAADVFVSFSKKTGLNSNLYKAMFAGLPMLLVKNELYKETVKVGTSNYLGEIFNWNFKKKKMRIDNKLSSNLKKEIIKYATDKYSSEAVYNKYIKEYKKGEAYEN